MVYMLNQYCTTVVQNSTQTPNLEHVNWQTSVTASKVIIHTVEGI